MSVPILQRECCGPPAASWNVLMAKGVVLWLSMREILSLQECSNRQVDTLPNEVLPSTGCSALDYQMGIWVHR